MCQDILMEITKSPEECGSLAEIRAELDRIDRGIIAALGARKQYVLAAAKFKTSETDVAAPERMAPMLQNRRRWAEEAGMSPDVIETMYRNLVQYFVAEELARWKDDGERGRGV
jgi:isochorismate pyruvate lyase